MLPYRDRAPMQRRLCAYTPHFKPTKFFRYPFVRLPSPSSTVLVTFHLIVGCSLCSKNMDVCELGTIEGACGHRICAACVKKSTIKYISTGRLHKFPSSFYGVKCPGMAHFLPFG